MKRIIKGVQHTWTIKLVVKGKGCVLFASCFGLFSNQFFIIRNLVTLVTNFITTTIMHNWLDELFNFVGFTISLNCKYFIQKFIQMLILLKWVFNLILWIL